MNTQQIASIVRQILSIAALTFGALTAALNSIKLPVGVSAALIAVGGALQVVEHYLSDPSTGSPAPTPPTPAPPSPAQQG